MPKKLNLLALLFILLLALAPLAWTADRINHVFVTNFHNPQQITGAVDVGNIIPHGELVRRTDLIVSPAQRHETTQFTDAGIIETDGFTFLVLSLEGQVKGRPFEGGSIGVILLPDEEPVVRAFQEEGQLHLTLEAAVSVAAYQAAYFSDSKSSLPIAFPRYRVLLYNSTDKTASVNLYAYLTN